MHTYQAFCSSIGDVRPGLYLRDDGTVVLWSDPDCSAWLAAGNTAPNSVAFVQRCTTEQFVLALRDLGLLATWHLGLSKAKQADQDRWAMRHADKILPLNNPVLTRIAALGPVDLPTVFTQAKSE